MFSANLHLIATHFACPPLKHCYCIDMRMFLFFRCILFLVSINRLNHCKVPFLRKNTFVIFAGICKVQENMTLLSTFAKI